MGIILYLELAKNNDNTQNSPSEKVVRRSVFFDDEGGEGDNVIPT